MAVIDTGSSVAGKANVTSNFQLEVHTPAVKEQAGFVGLAGIVDDGSLLGTPRVNRAYVSEAGRLAVAQSVALWEDDITVNAQNTAKYTAALTTYAATWTGGFLTLNSSGITTASSTATVSTYRSFPMFGRADLKVSTRALMTATPQAHTVYEIGLGKASGITAPTDGVFFRYNAVGELRGVINAGGVETQTAAMTQPSINVVHDYTIVVGDKVTLFFIDDVLAGKITYVTDAPTAGAATSASALPWFVRQYIDATGATVSSQLKVYDVVIALIGPDLVRPMSTLSAGMGLFAYQGQNGGTMGTTALYSNSLAAGTGSVASNTGSIVTGLGGQVSVQPTLAVSTDGILTSFQNPVGSTTQAGRNLVIKGVRIHGMVTTVLANTVATGFAFSLAFGHTAVSLATAEAANAKAPRRIALGMDTYAINAAVGTTGNIIDVKLDTPVVVNPGEFIQVVAKNITQVTTSGVITWLITFDGYFE